MVTNTHLATIPAAGGTNGLLLASAELLLSSNQPYGWAVGCEWCRVEQKPLNSGLSL